jgi:hypothetical protein
MKDIAVASTEKNERSRFSRRPRVERWPGNHHHSGGIQALSKMAVMPSINKDLIVRMDIVGIGMEQDIREFRAVSFNKNIQHIPNTGLGHVKDGLALGVEKRLELKKAFDANFHKQRII